MNFHRKQVLLLAVILSLSACAKQTLAFPPTATLPPPTETSAPPTETHLPPTETPIPAPTQDPAVFGAIGTGEIQAFALEPVANAIFSKVMDGFVAGGTVQAYQVTSVTIFPGGNGLLAEVIYNVRTADPAWLADGGTQADNNWINDNCSRFDFFTTETEYQLKNRRLCS
jgi:hypothetical protein